MLQVGQLYGGHKGDLEFMTNSPFSAHSLWSGTLAEHGRFHAVIDDLSKGNAFEIFA